MQHQQNLADQLRAILGNKPNIRVEVDSVKPTKPSSCEVTIYATEENQGVKRRIPASELSAFLNQPNIRQTLISNLAVETVAPKIKMDAEQLRSWLMAPPQGVVDPLIWAQAVADNPNPSELIPYPILGFQHLRERRNMQVEEGKIQKQVLQQLSDKVGRVERDAVQLETKLTRAKQRQAQLSNRLLKLVGAQAISHRHGYTLDGNEEKLQARLEALNAQLNAPMQVKSRLNEVLSTVRTQPELLLVGGRPADFSENGSAQNMTAAKCDYMDAEFLEDVQLHLKKCQEALEQLVKISQRDTKDLNIVAESSVGSGARGQQQFITSPAAFRL